MQGHRETNVIDPFCDIGCDVRCSAARDKNSYSDISGQNRTPTPRSPRTVGVFCENAASVMLPLNVTPGVSGNLEAARRLQPVSAAAKVLPAAAPAADQHPEKMMTGGRLYRSSAAPISM